MFKLYQVNPEYDVPLYQQLADGISKDIAGGTISAGSQLPTVRDLAERMGIARGTIKRAYDKLEQDSLVEKIQGRGTFVCRRAEASGSRKELAMAAIDALLDQLKAMNFSMTEINIFLNLKLRERADSSSALNIALVEGSPELLSQISEQLRKIEGTDVASFLLADVLASPYKIDENTDLLVTAAEYADMLSNILPKQQKIAKIAAGVAPASIARIVRLPAASRIGIICASEVFAEAMRKLCISYADAPDIAPPALFSNELDCAAYLASKDAVLLPDGYEKYCSGDALPALRAFARSHPLIVCSFGIDDGSMIYLSERIQRMADRNKI